MNSKAPLVSLTPEKIYMEAGLNYSITGEGDQNLGKYSNQLYLDSDTDITMENFMAYVNGTRFLSCVELLNSVT